MFEYKIELINTAKTKPPKIEAQLTALGREGWELGAGRSDPGF